MSATPWHRRFHSDALHGYVGLSLEERGAYTTILDLLYDRGEPIVENERLLAGHLDVSVRKARSVLESLLAKGKIYRTGDGHLSNARFEIERENELEMARKRAENGMKGGRPRSQPDKKPNENKATTKPEPNQDLSLLSLSLSPTLEKEDLTPDAAPNPESLVQRSASNGAENGAHGSAQKRAVEILRFDEFWNDAYPHRNGQKTDRKGALAKYAAAVKRGVPEAAIIDGARRTAKLDSRCPKFSRNPTTWLNQEGWTDDFTGSRGAEPADNYEAWGIRDAPPLRPL